MIFTNLDDLPEVPNYVGYLVVEDFIEDLQQLKPQPPSVPKLQHGRRCQHSLVICTVEDMATHFCLAPCACCKHFEGSTHPRPSLSVDDFKLRSASSGWPSQTEAPTLHGFRISFLSLRIELKVQVLIYTVSDSNIPRRLRPRAPSTRRQLWMQPLTLHPNPLRSPP